MNAFLSQNKEVLTFSFSFLTILLTFFFRGIWEWRQKICFGYDSKRDVAVSILHDTFIHEATAHYEKMADGAGFDAEEAAEIYKKPESQIIISGLALSLEKSNRVKRYYTFLDGSSRWAINSLWACIVLVACPIANIWLTVPAALVWIWVLLLLAVLAVFISSVSILLYFDSRFFRIVNNIIKPEND
ncbi:MAG: hypothetical protein WB729_06770 [Candidatus Sulfotelmatobacter sp.]